MPKPRERSPKGPILAKDHMAFVDDDAIELAVLPEATYKRSKGRVFGPLGRRKHNRCAIDAAIWLPDCTPDAKASGSLDEVLPESPERNDNNGDATGLDKSREKEEDTLTTASRHYDENAIPPVLNGLKGCALDAPEFRRLLHHHC
jgi:hypothetical protein